MNYVMFIILFLILSLIINVISPFIRNVLKFKENKPLENNIGGFLVKKLYKKK